MKSVQFLIALSIAIASTPSIAATDVSNRYDRWEERLRSRVDQLHVYPDSAPKGASGDVLVRFRVDGGGKPADITIVRSSGEAAFDSAAVRLVAKLGRLGPIPSANGAVETVTLKLSYGDGPDGSRERIANERRNRTIVSRAERLADRR